VAAVVVWSTMSTHWKWRGGKQWGDALLRYKSAEPWMAICNTVETGQARDHSFRHLRVGGGYIIASSVGSKTEEDQS